MKFSDAKQRFSNRVEDYVRYRPGYPSEVLHLLHKWCKLQPHHVIADVGSGTGLLAKLFLEHGNTVIGVEPNAEMRAAGEEFLKLYKHFTSVNGSAEATTLGSDNVDFVASGQAFHWFDVPKAREEFRRILKQQGRVLVLWNERLLDETPFLREYEKLLRSYGTDYARVQESYPRAEQMLAFFGPNEFTSHSLPNYQEFDLEGLSGRLRSSSYAPAPGDAKFAPMMAALEKIFAVHKKHGKVRLEYRTHVYAGKLELIG